VEGPSPYACGRDFDTELECRNGKFSVLSTCRGPKGCRVVEPKIQCDDSIAAAGDPCVRQADAANFGCATDKKAELECDEATSKFRVSKPCRGPRGCYIADDLVHCDGTLARAGEPCRPPGNRACSDSGTLELKCLPDLTWGYFKDCPEEGCRAEIEKKEIVCR
jgi:hypothetical protein